MGCGLVVRLLRHRRYVYFWSYAAGPRGSRRVWTYVGPVGRTGTRRKASELLLAYHRRARQELDRRIARLTAVLELRG